jgi:hypothetical protein
MKNFQVPDPILIFSRPALKFYSSNLLDKNSGENPE